MQQQTFASLSFTSLMKTCRGGGTEEDMRYESGAKEAQEMSGV
jgi:hypothetical protein